MSSVFGKIFGRGKKQVTATTPQESIQQLREVEEILVKKQEFLEKKIEAEVASARKHGTKNKRLALHALKRKKQFEKQLQHVDGTLSTIELQREAIENASTNAEVLQVLASTVKVLKSAHNAMDVDQVHDLMEDIAEQQEIANEIDEAISTPIGFGQDIDEDDLLRELEELEQEELDKQLLNVGPVPAASTLPEVPTASIAESAPGKLIDKLDGDDLAKLEAWANA